MFVVDALPASYIEARTEEWEAARKAQMEKALAPSACSSASSSTTNTPMSSPNPSGNPGGLLGYFAAWRKAEGCAVAGSEAAKTGSMPTCKITSNHFR